jgi:hypothetical protein
VIVDRHRGGKVVQMLGQQLRSEGQKRKVKVAEERLSFECKASSE